MKRVAVAVGALATFLSTSVQAQESASTNWTGPYLGLTLNSGWETAVGVAASNVIAISGPGKANWGSQIGGQFGFDAEFGRWSVFGQSGRWVVGAEAELGMGSQSMPLPVGLAPQLAICRGTIFPFRCEPLPIQTPARKLDTLGMASTRLRGGIAWRRWLFYGVGGVILQSARVNAQDTYLERDNFIESDCQSGDPICFVTATDRRNLWGWTAGVGGEFSVSRNLTVALEYRHAEIGHETFTFDHPIFSGAPEGYGFSLVPFHRPGPSSVSLSADRAALRLYYRFHSS